MTSTLHTTFIIIIVILLIYLLKTYIEIRQKVSCKWLTASKALSVEM